MDKVSLNLKGLCGWGIQQAVGHIEKQTNLPLGELVTPVANGLLTSLGIHAVEIDPMIFLMGRIVYAGIERQRKVTEANKGVQSVRS